MSKRLSPPLCFDCHYNITKFFVPKTVAPIIFMSTIQYVLQRSYIGVFVACKLVVVRHMSSLWFTVEVTSKIILYAETQMEIQVR